MKFKDSYPSELYRDFRDIRQSDVYAHIRFYEKHAGELQNLGREEHFTVCCYYANALFAAGEYERYLQFAPGILETSIIDNIQFVDDTDVYLHTLEKMAVSNAKLKNHEKAVHLAVQLFKISGRKKKYARLIRNLLKQQRPKSLLNFFAFAVLMILLWTAVEISQLIILEPFYSETAVFTDLLQTLFLFTAFVCLTIYSAGHYIFVERRFRKLV